MELCCSFMPDDNLGTWRGESLNYISTVIQAELPRCIYSMHHGQVCCIVIYLLCRPVFFSMSYNSSSLFFMHFQVHKPYSLHTISINPTSDL